MTNLGETIRDNPLPVALIGAGLGWLLMAGMRGGHPHHEHRPHHDHGPGDGHAAHHGGGGMADAARSALGSVGEKAQDAYGSARRAAGDTWSAARDHASHLGETVRHRTRDWSDAAAGRAQEACRSVGEMIEERPLLLGAAGLIIGAGLGAMLPRTRYEDELLGETRDSLKRSAEELGREHWEKAQHVVEKTVETVREEAERQGLTPEALKETATAMVNRAGKVAQSAADAAREEAGRQTPQEDSGGGKGAGSSAGSGSVSGGSAG